MKTSNRFIQHYKDGYMPWAHQNPDFNLVDMVKDFPIKPCKALELGCGTGTDAIWLAKSGFDISAVDVSEVAIDLARENAQKASVDCHFYTLDFCEDKPDRPPYDFVFDRGYFHSYKTINERKKIAARIADLLSPGGLWLTLMGSCDSPPREGGPPMRSANEIASVVEPLFEILLLKASVFGNDEENPAKNWVCLMKRRSDFV
jgi:SAM-dependent methyltransferase